MKEIKITIPEELTISQYEQLGQYEHLSEIQKIIRIISVISGYEEEEIEKWDLQSLNSIYTDLLQAINNIEPRFIPVFEFKGVKYGIQPFSKMSGGEYISIENKLKDGKILDVISILYRPITKNKLGSLKWELKSTIKYLQGKAENLFKYYNIEEYDTETVEWRKDIFQELPVSIALGAYTFFLTVGLQLSSSILHSSQQMEEKEKEIMMMEMEKVLESIGVGSLHSKDSQKMEES